jgi:hypothetical protein
MGRREKYLEGLYGKLPTPLTGSCTTCSARVRLKKDGTLWRHGRKSKKNPTGCRGSGMAPKPGTVKRQRPSRPPGGGSRSVRAVSGGAVESSRRRH